MSESLQTLLPAESSTLLEKQLSVLNQTDLSPHVIRSLWNPQTCPEYLLPWLAWAFSVDVWDDRWPLETRRQVVADSLAVHRIKGTVASVKRMLSSLGYPEAEIDEFRHRSYRTGIVRDGWHTRGGRDPFVYRVRLNKLTSLAQAKVIAAALDETAPVRCQLFNNSLDFRADPPRRNGSIFRDGQYSRGIARV